MIADRFHPLDMPAQQTDPIANSTCEISVQSLNPPLTPDHWPSTHWTQLGMIGQTDTLSYVDTINSIVLRYQPALLAHLQFKFRLPDPSAQDVLQSFLEERVLVRNFLALAERERGRFRNFLLRSIDNFVLNHLRSQKALHRSPPGGYVTWEDMEGWEPISESPEPGDRFDLVWAKQVMELARDRMEAECNSSKRPDIWDVFQGRILRPLLEGAEVVGYGDLVLKHQFRDPDQAGNVLITGKRMFQRCLRRVVAEYVQDPAAVEEEILALVAILGRVGI